MEWVSSVQIVRCLGGIVPEFVGGLDNLGVLVRSVDVVHGNAVSGRWRAGGM